MSGFPLDRFTAAPDLRDAIAAWLSWLGDERRCSPHTIGAYGRTLRDSSISSPAILVRSRSLR
jgi:hypothetical protein